MGRWDSGWPRYVPVAERREKAKRKVNKMRKKGQELEPVEIEGRKIARTFWGEGWCDHLESFSDYANRLPRGRSYVRNGLVCHLVLSECRIEAMVMGSKVYNVEVIIKKLPAEKWASLRKNCAGKIGSLMELLEGKLSANVMTVMSDRQEGLFPLPGEIKFHCDCPDWAGMCKHVAAVLYGAGKRLDERPELLFLLRGVNQEDLIMSSAESTVLAGDAGGESKKSRRRRVADRQLEDVFGIDLSAGEDEDGNGAAGEVISEGKRGKGSEGAGDNLTDANKTGYEAGSLKDSVSGPPAVDTDSITSETVSTLRQFLGLSQKEFAALLKVSPLTVCNWENKRGPLKLHGRCRKALLDAATMTAEQARSHLR